MIDRTRQAQGTTSAVPGADEIVDVEQALRKVEALFTALRDSSNANPAGPSPGDSNSVSQRFRILHRHARGGLGDIWLAHDEELNRQVALKEIQPQFAGHSQSRSRFLREATITGQLEHPGIVPIYALGRHENGQPFYAMRFVQGDTLQHAIARLHRRDMPSITSLPQRNLERRKLVTRFIDVCNAIAYAHSRGILHRDIKPSNIMLGEFGETLVVDWGLAKVFGEIAPPTSTNAHGDSNESLLPIETNSQPAPTQIGSVIGSPPYMSPEQAAGWIDQLSPATDIYSLGASLYELLTGQTPIGIISGDDPQSLLATTEALQQIREGGFPRPTTVNPDVPRALEAMCLKAMALRPEDRYASARDLASDLEAWLADEPVTAWTEPLSIRTRRWMRRHQTAVTSTAAAALVAIVTLSVLAVVIADRNERLATAKANLENTNSQLAESNRQIKTEVEHAIRSADEARTVLEFFQQKVLAAARPKGQDGGLGVNATIREAIDAAEPQIGQTFNDQPLVEASIRNVLGMSYHYLGEAVLATQQHDRARTLRSTMLGPDHPATFASTNNLALAHQAAGELEQVIPLFEEVLELMKVKLGSDHPDTLCVMNNLASAYQMAGKSNQAKPLFEKTLMKRREILGVNHIDTLASMSNLAVAHKDAGKLNKAIALCGQTVEATRAALGSDHPDTLQVVDNLASAFHAAGKTDQAIPLFEQTLKKRQVLLGASHPNTLASMNNLALAYQAAGEFDRVVSLFDDVLEKTKTKLGPDHPETLTSMNNLAAAHQDMGEFNKAISLFEQALAKQQTKLGANHPSTLITMNNLALAYKDAGQLDRAIPFLKKTLMMCKAICGPDHPDTISSMNNLALAFQAGDQLDQAIRLFEEIFEKEKATSEPEHPRTLRSINNLALAYKDAGRLDQAIPLFERALEKQDSALGHDHPDTLTTMNNLALAYLGGDRFTEAETLFREAVDGLRSKFSLAHPKTLLVLNNLIGCYTKLQQPEKAEPLLREIASHWKDKAGVDSPEYAGGLAMLSLNLLEQHKFSAAELLLRRCMAIRAKTEPDDWKTFNTKSMLGGSLLGQKNYADAEPLLLAGYEGMTEHAAEIPLAAEPRLIEAQQRIVQLYESWGKLAQAAKWRAKLSMPPKSNEK